jgi:hypothetical protein
VAALVSNACATRAGGRIKKKTGPALRRPAALRGRFFFPRLPQGDFFRSAATHDARPLFRKHSNFKLSFALCILKNKPRLGGRAQRKPKETNGSGGKKRGRRALFCGSARIRRQNSRKKKESTLF